MTLAAQRPHHEELVHEFLLQSLIHARIKLCSEITAAIRISDEEISTYKIIANTHKSFQGDRVLPVDSAMHECNAPSADGLADGQVTEWDILPARSVAAIIAGHLYSFKMLQEVRRLRMSLAHCSSTQ